jgi:hypothetical protein
MQTFSQNIFLSLFFLRHAKRAIPPSCYLCWLYFYFSFNTLLVHLYPNIFYIWHQFHYNYTHDIPCKYFFPMARQPLGGLGRLIIEASRSHTDTPHSVGLLWTSDQLVSETSTWQHTTLTTDRHPCPTRDSNPYSQQANGRRHTP